MNKIVILFASFIGMIMVAWIYQGIRLYPEYKKGIYPELYGYFLWYFWDVVVLQDASVSPYLSSKIGKSYIVFSKIQDKGVTLAKFCTIFHNKGIMSVCFENVNGKVKSNDANKDWFIKRIDEKTNKETVYRHNNITLPFAIYLNKLANQYKDTHIEARVALSDDTDFTMLKSNIKVVHYSDVINEIKNTQADFLNDDEVKALFKEAIKQ